MKTYICGRCGGSGRIEVHANVLNGVCFECHGSGHSLKKPAKRSPKWAVFGNRRDDGSPARLYNVFATSEEKAVEKARRIYEKASTAFRDEYTLSAATAVLADSLTQIGARS